MKNKFDLNKSMPYVVIPIKKVNNDKDFEKLKFLGRVRLKDKLLNTLKRARDNGGCFLVGGYRGVGKTKLVEMALADLLKEERPDEKRETSSGLRNVIKSLIKRCKTLLSGNFTSDDGAKKQSFKKTETLNIDLGVDSELSTRDIMCDIVEAIYQTDAISELTEKRSKYQLVTFSLFGIFIILMFELMLRLKVMLPPELSYTFGLSIFLAVFLALLIPIVNLLSRKHQMRMLKSIEELVSASRYRREKEVTTAISTAISKNTFLRSRNKTSQEPISSRRLQQKLKELFTNCQEMGIRFIVVFDEVDKINPVASEKASNETASRKQKVDELLGGLKPLINGSKCTFIVIAGREIVDAFHSESGYTSVLYEGVFDDVFYVPTLLTDWSDGQENKYHSMVEQYLNQVLFKEPNKSFAKDGIELFEGGIELYPDSVERDSLEFLNILFFYNLFIRYLTLHSWGNFKRLKVMMKDHIEFQSQYLRGLVDNNYLGGFHQSDVIDEQKMEVLLFTPSDIRRMFVSARLYGLFDVNVGRITSKIDDKAAVTSLITILDVFRFHSRGFSRAMVDRTVAGIDIHAEASLSFITDDFVTATFQSMIRRTSDNLFPYRFYISTDMEFSYLAKILGAKSSSYEFALDSAEPVRQFYVKKLQEYKPDGTSKSSLSAAKLESILGDLYTSEQKHDMAAISFSDTLYMLKNLLRTENGEEWRSGGGVSYEAHATLIHTLLKKGILEEVRENMSLALSIYAEAKKAALVQFGKIEDTRLEPREYRSINELLDKQDESCPDYRYISRAKVAQLATKFVHLKAGSKISLTDKELGEYLRDDSAEKFDIKFLVKAFSLMYYANDYNALGGKWPQEITRGNFRKDADKSFRKILRKFAANDECRWERAKFDDHDAGRFLYIYGQALFSELAKNIRQKIKEQYDKSGSQNLAEVNRDFLKDWVELVGVLSNAGKKLSYESFYELRKSGTGHNKEDVNLMIRSFYYVFAAADSAKKKGKHADAAHKYTSILLNWIALLEILPWGNIKQFKVDDIGLAKIGHEPAWLEDVISDAQMCVEKAERSANVMLREGILHEYSDGCNNENSIFERHKKGLRVSSILKRLKSDEEFPVTQQTDEEQFPCYSSMVWCRSNISNYLLIFGLWEMYCRYSINRWINYAEPKTTGFSKRENSSEEFNIRKIPVPVGNLPRVHALYLWLLARQKMHQLVRVHKKVRCHNCYAIEDDNAQTSLGLITEIATGLVQALHEYRKAFRSDDPDSFPSKTHILFNLKELQEFIDEACNKKEIRDGLEAEFARQRRDRFEEKANSEGFETMLRMSLDKEYLQLHLKKYAYDLYEINDVSSQSFRRKVRHKYFLYDDFEDPFYIGEWSYLRMMSSTVPLLLGHEYHGVDDSQETSGD